MATTHIHYIPFMTYLMHFSTRHITYVFELVVENYKTVMIFLTHPTKNNKKVFFYKWLQSSAHGYPGYVKNPKLIVFLLS